MILHISVEVVDELSHPVRFGAVEVPSAGEIDGQPVSEAHYLLHSGIGIAHKFQNIPGGLW